MENREAQAHLATMIHRGHMVSWVVQTIGGVLFIAGGGSGAVMLVTALFEVPALGAFISGVLCLVVAPLWLAGRQAPGPSDDVRRRLGLPQLGEDNG